MENMADAPEDSWRSQTFRQNVITKIGEAIRQSGNPTAKSVAEMESHVFQKAKSKEEYLGFVARLIIHVREMNPKKAMIGSVPNPNLGQGGISQGGQVSDPMSALKSMAGGPGASGGTVTIQSQPGGQTQMTASLLGSGGTLMQGGPQPMGPGSMQQNVVTSSINPQGMSPMVMQTRFLGPGGVMNNQNVQQRPMLAPNVQLLQKFRQVPQGGPPPNVTSTQIMTNQGPNSNQSAVPSPVGHHPSNMGPQMAPSPAMYGHSPNPQVAPSPTGSYSVRTPGAPSPGSALNTPISGTAAPSPINRSNEEALYLEKRKQLSKFIEPLKLMIARIDKDENKKKDLNRMKNLLDILSDPSRRCPMDVLLKCEQVLEKINPMQDNMGINQSQVMPQKTQEQNICQPLLDALTNLSKTPLFNHILDKTFGPPISALFGASIRNPAPPPKKRKIDDDPVEISDVLQGEIARLDQKFKVQIDPVQQHNTSVHVNLICQLDDKNLPCVPSINIKVPENYPEKPPQCSITHTDYEYSSILQSIQNILSNRVSSMPQEFSITSLLDTWEMSVRQACATKSDLVEI